MRLLVSLLLVVVGVSCCGQDNDMILTVRLDTIMCTINDRGSDPMQYSKAGYSFSIPVDSVYYVLTENMGRPKFFSEPIKEIDYSRPEPQVDEQAQEKESIMVQKQEVPVFARNNVKGTREYKFHKSIKKAGGQLKLGGIMISLGIVIPAGGLLLYTQGYTDIAATAAGIGGVMFLIGGFAIVDGGVALVEAARNAPPPPVD